MSDGEKVQLGRPRIRRDSVELKVRITPGSKQTLMRIAKRRRTSVSAMLDNYADELRATTN